MMITSLIKDEDDDDECNDMIIKRSVSWTRRKDRWACLLSSAGSILVACMVMIMMIMKIRIVLMMVVVVKEAVIYVLAEFVR